MPTHLASMTPLKAMRSISSAKHDDGDDEEAKKASFQQIGASKDATAVGRLAYLLTDGSNIEKSFRKKDFP